MIRFTHPAFAGLTALALVASLSDCAVGPEFQAAHPANGRGLWQRSSAG